MLHANCHVHTDYDEHRLKQHGRCQRPHYVEPLAEDRQSQTCQTEMKDHENTPVDSQMSVADELSIGNVIDGQIQTAAGNVEALPKQNEHSEVANVIEVCKFMA